MKSIFKNTIITLAVSLGFLVMVGFQIISPTRIIMQQTSPLSIPTFKNPIPNCTTCIQEHGLVPRCVNSCIQEVLIPTEDLFSPYYLAN